MTKSNLCVCAHTCVHVCVYFDLHEGKSEQRNRQESGGVLLAANCLVSQSLLSLLLNMVGPPAQGLDYPQCPGSSNIRDQGCSCTHTHTHAHRH